MNLFRNILTAGALALSAFIVSGADNFFTAGVGVGTTTLSTAVLPHTGKSFSGQQTAQGLLTYLNVTTDTNGAVQFYNCGTPAQINFTNSGTTMFVNLTNSTSGSVTLFTNANGYTGQILIFHKATGVYERRTLGVATGGTNLVTTVATTNSLNDLVWPLALGGTIPVNATTKELNAAGGGGGIYVADPGEPLMFDIRGGTNCSINSWSGRFP